jgi:hypothetical protein
MLIRLRLRAALIDTPPAPPAHPTLPPKRRVVTKAVPPRVNPRRLRLPFRRPALTLPLPTLDIEFVAPGRRMVHQVNEPGMQAHLLQLAESCAAGHVFAGCDSAGGSKRRSHPDMATT